MFTAWDAVTAAVLLLGCALWLWSAAARPTGRAVVIEQNGTELFRTALTPDGERIEVPVCGEREVVIVIEGGAAWFAQADCPDRVCIRTGKLSRSGETAACLPAGVILRVEGELPPQDGMTG